MADDILYALPVLCEELGPESNPVSPGNGFDRNTTCGVFSEGRGRLGGTALR